MGIDPNILKGLQDRYVPCLPNGGTEKLLNVRIYKTLVEEYILENRYYVPKEKLALNKNGNVMPSKI